MIEDNKKEVKEKATWWIVFSAGSGWSEPFYWAGQEKILQGPKGTFPTRLVPDNDIGYFFIAVATDDKKSPLVEKGKTKRGTYI